MNRLISKAFISRESGAFARFSILVYMLVFFLCESAWSSSSRVLSMSVYRTMSFIQESIQQEKYDIALEELQNLLTEEGKLKKYDRAKIFEMLASIYMVQEKYTLAVKYAEQALYLDTLEEASIIQLHQRLLYLYLFLENYSKAIENVEIWFKLEPDPSVQSHFTAAQIYALADRMEEALSYALRGMQKFREMPEQTPRESWFQLLVSIHFRFRNYQEAANILEQSVNYWPQRRTYYLQLSALYQELNQPKNAFAVLSIAYQNNLLDKEPDISRLVQMYRYFEYPFKGASILSYSLKQKAINSDEANWAKTADAWLQAREWSQAETALIKAAGLSRDGIHWLRLCQSTFQDERWSESQQHCNQALKKGKLGEEEGAAWYLLALSRYYDNKVHEAKSAFEHCINWEKTKSDCELWTNRLTKDIADKQEEMKRRKQQQLENKKRPQEVEQNIEKALKV